MTLLRILSRRVGAVGVRSACPGTGAAERPPCGWYDSSHDLRQGLVVHEEDAAAELPLHLWLEAQLRGWDGAAAA